MAEVAQGVQQEALNKALRRLLRPLVRLMIRRSIPFPVLSELIKGVYVEAAIEDFEVEGKRQTDSRVNLLTGVHRKDVRRLRAKIGQQFSPPKRASLSTQVIARWTTEEEYKDEHGNPRPLPRLSTSEASASFESLVRSINTDIRPRVLLDEWLRLGVAGLDTDGCVHLKVEAFVPEEGSEEMSYYFGRNVHDHIAAGVHNLLGEKPPFLERSTYYNNLTAESVEELRDMARKEGMEALRAVNARALQLQRRDSGQPAAQSRINFGAYFFEAEDAESEEPDADAGESGDGK